MGIDRVRALRAVLTAGVAGAVLTTAVIAGAQTASVPPVSAKPEVAKVVEEQRQLWVKLYGKTPYPDAFDTFVTSKPEPLQPLYRSLYIGGERNAVVNFQRLGLAAMQLGYWTEAEKAFDGALNRIEAVYAKNPQAEAARSIFHKESNKAFKGEPYERAMAYYYRGILYLRKGDYENARASFKTAEYQDTVSEAEEYKGDFAALNYLAGWASQCNGQPGQADEEYKAAVAAKPGLAAPPADANVLMIAELGHGPLKAKDGKQKEKMVFVAGEASPEDGATWTLAPAKGSAATYNAVLASSVYEQATTRGGRAIDGILAGKASWKTNTNGVGQVGMAAGLAMMSDPNASLSSQQAGGYMAMAGLALSLFSSAMKTDADARHWETLPDGIDLATGKMGEGEWVPTVAFTEHQKAMTLASTPVMKGQGKKCAVVWARSRPAMPVAYDVPGDDPKVATTVARKKDVMAKDQQFRTELMAL